MHTIHTNDDAVLNDNCPRCAEQAQNFRSLDRENLRALWDEMMKVEMGPGRDYYRTKTEAAACRRMYEMYLTMLDLGIAPDAKRLETVA